MEIFKSQSMGKVMIVLSSVEAKSSPGMKTYQTNEHLTTHSLKSFCYSNDAVGRKNIQLLITSHNVFT